MREERTIGLGPGLAGFILVIIIAWALAAVLMLTGTLTNARQINQRVKLVNAQVGPIDSNLASVQLAGRTGRISAQIKLAAANLSGELNQVISAAGHIDAKVGSILTTARSINTVVTSINSTAHAINNTVHAIGSNVQSISASVAGIGASVGSIHSRVATVEGAVGAVGATDQSINADVTRIQANLAATLRNSHSIRDGIVAINGRADTIIGLSRQLKSDFDNVLAAVGTAIGGPTIIGHANSIDCSRLINLVGPTTGCGK
jgi:prefoldin subunit 5